MESRTSISGQLPFRDGELLGEGVVGRGGELETAKELARHAALDCLAAAVWAVGDMDRVRIVQMPVFEATRRTSVCSRRVSDPLIEVFGENGRHARTAIGDAGPPLNIRPVEIQMICTVV